MLFLCLIDPGLRVSHPKSYPLSPGRYRKAAVEISFFSIVTARVKGIRASYYTWVACMGEKRCLRREKKKDESRKISICYETGKSKPEHRIFI